MTSNIKVEINDKGTAYLVVYTVYYWKDGKKEDLHTYTTREVAEKTAKEWVEFGMAETYEIVPRCVFFE